MAVQTNTIHASWTNFILHASSFIAERKNRLQTAHALAAILLVIELMLAEVWLAIISLPLYLVTKNVAGKTTGTGQYKARRVITLSVLSSILVIWIIKLLIILLFLFVLDPREAFQVQETNTQIDQALTVTTSIPKAAVDAKLSVPHITTATGTQGSVTITGTAKPNQTVVAILQEAHGADSENPPGLYSGKADNAGQFTIAEDKGVFYVPVGDYIVSVVTYDEARGTKSQTSNGLKFTVAEHPARHILHFLDQILNLLVFGFIIVGIAAVVLSA